MRRTKPNIVAALFGPALLIASFVGTPSVPQDGKKPPSRFKRTRQQVFVKSYPIADLTGRDEAERLRALAADGRKSDEERCRALAELEHLENEGEIARRSEEVAELMRRMLNPPFDAEKQSLYTGDGTELLMSGIRMQHNSVRLLLESLRREDREVQLEVRVYELPPVPVPVNIVEKAKRNDDVRSLLHPWFSERLQAVGIDTPTYQRSVIGKIGSPIRISLTRRVPAVTDYRWRALVDSEERVLEPVIEEIVEGPVIEALIGRFEDLQLVVKAELEHRSVRRPIASRAIEMEDGTRALLQRPIVDVVEGRTGIHLGFGGDFVLSTIHPPPIAPRTDYWVVIRVDRP